MKKFILILSLLITLQSCSSKKEDPLIIPPDFSEMPDPKNPEKINKAKNDEEITNLKNLLLKSEE